QLRFAFTATHPDAAFLAGQVAPEPGQPREQMLQLRQFNLQLSLFCPGALSKNVEDQRSPIENLAVKYPFEIAALGGRKFVVEDDGVDIRAAAMLGEFVRFAFADESRGTRRDHSLQAIPDDLSSSGGGQFGKFFQ